MALALLAVVAIGLAAATLNSAVVTDSSGGGFGVGAPESDSGVPAENGSEFSFGNGSETVTNVFEFPCYPVLNELWAIGAIVGAFLLGAALAYRGLGPLGVAAYVGPVGVPLMLVHALLTACTTPTAEKASLALFNDSNNSSVPAGGGGPPGSGSSTTLTDPSTLLLIGLGVALLTAVALLFVSSSGNDPNPEEASGEPDPSGDVAAVGRAAGEAADRIESSTDVDNEVFRAWREMTSHLDVPNPQSSTPAEFAGAAVEAGMDRDDVAELTSLFEAVRYGGESPTEEHERRAIEALRRIEREYAGDGG